MAKKIKEVVKVSNKVPEREADNFIKFGNINIPVWHEGKNLFVAILLNDQKDIVMTLSPSMSMEEVKLLIAESVLDFCAVNPQPKKYWR